MSSMHLASSTHAYVLLLISVTGVLVKLFYLTSAHEHLYKARSVLLFSMRLHKYCGILNCWVQLNNQLLMSMSVGCCTHFVHQA